MGLWQKMKVRLGLEDDWDEYYDDEDEGYESEAVETRDEYDSSPRRGAYQSPYGSGAGQGAVKRLDRGPDLDRARSSASQLKSVPTGAASVTPVSSNMKMHIAEPKSFTEAQSIADKFKRGTPVILNLSATQSDLAKRLLDFASGLTYGLDGGLQKISDKVFMLTPHNVDVSDADRRRLRDTGLFPRE
ncbi:MAG: cell division protein SepF [Coriobacteriia bacterium]|nr:cell division protein SepF [Coriobacteriia bacterium]